MNNYKRRNDFNSINQCLKTSKQSNIDGTNRSNDQNFKTSTKSNIDGRNLFNDLNKGRQQLALAHSSLTSEIFQHFQEPTSSRDSQNNKKHNFDKDFEEIELLNSLAYTNEEYNESQGPITSRGSRNTKDFEQLKLLSSISRNQSELFMENESETLKYNNIVKNLQHQLKNDKISNTNLDYQNFQGLNSFRNNKNLNFDKDLEELELLSSRNESCMENKSVTTRDNKIVENRRHQLKSDRNTNKTQDYHDFQGPTASRVSRNTKEFEDLELLSFRSRNPSKNFQRNESLATRDSNIDEALRNQFESDRISNKNEDYHDFQGATSSRDGQNNKKQSFDEDFEELELLSSRSRNQRLNYMGNESVRTRDNGSQGLNSSRNNKKLNFDKDLEEIQLLSSRSRNLSANYNGNESKTTRDNDLDEAMRHQLKSNRNSNKNEDYLDFQGPTTLGSSRNTNNFEELELLSSRSRNDRKNYMENESVPTRKKDIDEAMQHQLKSNRISNKNENYHDSLGPNSSRYSRNTNDFEDLELLSSRSRNESKNYIGNMSRDNDEDRHQQLKRQRISNKNEDYYDSQGANSRNSRNNKITNFDRDFNELELLSSTSRNQSKNYMGQESVTLRESEINSSNTLTKIRQKLLSLNAPALSQQSSISNYPATSMNKSYTNDSEQTQWNGEIYQQKELSNYQGNNQSETKISPQSSNYHNNSSNALMQLRQKLASIRTEARSTDSSSSNQNFTNSANTRNFNDSVDEYLQHITTAVNQQNDLNLAGPSLTQQKPHPADLYPNNLNIQRIERGYWEKELNRSCSSSTSDDSYAPERKTTKRTQEDIFDSDFVTDNKNYNIEDSSSKAKKSLKIKQPWFDPEMMEARKKARRLFNQAKEKGNWDDYKEAMKRFKYMTRKAKRSAAQNSVQAESDYTNR